MVEATYPLGVVCVNRAEFMEFANKVFDFLADFREEFDPRAQVVFTPYYVDIPESKNNSVWYIVKSKEFQRAVVRYVAGTYQHPADTDKIEALARKHGLRVWEIEVRGAEDGDVQVGVSLEPQYPLETDVVY